MAPANEGREAEPVGIHVALYETDDLRGAVRADARGRTARANLQAVQALLDGSDVAPSTPTRLTNDEYETDSGGRRLSPIVAAGGGVLANHWLNGGADEVAHAAQPASPQSAVAQLWTRAGDDSRRQAADAKFA